MKPQLSELQSTIKELQRLGAFSDEELTWLGDMDKSMDDLSKELQDKLEVKFTNISENPDPVLNGNKIILKVSSQETLSQFDGGTYIRTGIKLSLPPNIIVHIKPTSLFFTRGVFIAGWDYLDEELTLLITNFGSNKIILSPGEELAELYFLYSLGSETLTLSKS